MSSIKVVSCVMPVSTPLESYPKAFLDLSKDKSNSIKTEIYTDPLTNETFQIKKLYIKEDENAPNSVSNYIKKDPSFVPLSEQPCIASGSNSQTEQKDFQFRIPVQISKLAVSENTTLNTTEPVECKKKKKKKKKSKHSEKEKEKCRNSLDGE